MDNKELEGQLNNLPEEIDTLLYSAEMYAAIKQVSVKYKLHIDQMDLLESETSQVLLGRTTTEQFPQVIAKSLQIDQAQANEIAKEVNDLLFAKVRDAMKAVYEKGKQEPKVIGVGEMPKPTAPLPTPPSPTPPSMPPPAPASIPTPTLKVEEVKPLGVETMPKAPTTSAVDNPLLHAADKMLSEPTVSKLPTPPVSEKPSATTSSATDPKKYNLDPYREPPTP